MTAHYKEMGTYFPELLRVEQLIKIARAIKELRSMRRENYAELKHNQALLNDTAFLKNYFDKSHTEHLLKLQESYTSLSSDFRQLCPPSDIPWWNGKYNTIYNQKLSVLAEATRKFPKFSFQLNDPETTEAYNNAYNANFNALYNSNYQANKDAIIQKHGLPAWTSIESRICSEIKTQINAALAKNLTMQTVLDELNAGRIKLREEVRMQYYKNLDEIKNTVGDAAYSSMITNFIAGNYIPLATSIAQHEVAQMKQGFNAVQLEYYNIFIFLKEKLGEGNYVNCIEQLLQGNFSPLANALANNTMDSIKEHIKSIIAEKQKFENEFTALQFGAGALGELPQWKYVPAVYNSYSDMHVYGGFNADPICTEANTLARNLHNPFKIFKESAIREAQDFIKKAGLFTASCLLAGSTYAQSHRAITNLEIDIRKAQNELFWLELKEKNERQQNIFKRNQDNFNFNMDYFNPAKLATNFFMQDPFSLFRYEAQMEEAKTVLSKLAQQEALKPYLHAQQVFSSLYTAVESYGNGKPTSHMDGVGRGATQSLLDIFSLLAHPVDHLLYPVSQLLVDATIITSSSQTPQYLTDPDIISFCKMLTANSSLYKNAVIRMQDRGMAIQDVIKNYIEAVPEVRTQQTARVLVPGYVLKAIKTISKLQNNLKTFNQLNPPSFATDGSLIGRKPTSLSVEEVRNHGKQHSIDDPLMYVIKEDGTLIITEQNYDHWHLGEGNPVKAAGDLYINEQGLISEVDNRSGSYAPQAQRLGELVEHVYEQKGFPEVRGKYVDWFLNKQQYADAAAKAGYQVSGKLTAPMIVRPNFQPNFFGVSIGTYEAMINNNQQETDKKETDQERSNMYDANNNSRKFNRQ